MAQTADSIHKWPDTDPTWTAVGPEHHDVSKIPFFHDEHGQPVPLLAVIWENSKQPGYLRFSQRRIRIRTIDHESFCLEHDPKGDVSRVAIDRADERQHFIIGELDGDVGRAAPLR